MIVLEIWNMTTPLIISQRISIQMPMEKEMKKLQCTLQRLTFELCILSGTPCIPTCLCITCSTASAIPVQDFRPAVTYSSQWKIPTSLSTRNIPSIES